jgi:FkbH-like protein
MGTAPDGMTKRDSVVGAERDDDMDTRGRVKCVVWDLDDTLWDGILLEDDDVLVRAHLIDAVRRLDRRGILNSIASKSDHDLAMQRLEAAGVADLFVYPQITWSPKSASIQRIASLLNIATNAFAFVDDQQFELAEVAHTIPGILCVHVDEVLEIMKRPEFHPRFITDEARQRRAMYVGAAARDAAEREFVGTSEEFLATLDMCMRIREASKEDLQRAEELTIRTNQLNSTGRPIGYAELDEFRSSPTHCLLVASLQDRWGSYGTIAMALVDKRPQQVQPIDGSGFDESLVDVEQCWSLRLLLTSCRVVSRGVGTLLLNYVMRLARNDGMQLLADFVPTDRNRMTYLMYAFAGFRELGINLGDGAKVLHSTLNEIQAPPTYLTLQVG